jgi:hypothetical protein
MSCWWSNFLLLRTRPCCTRQLGTQNSYQSVEIGLTVAASLTGGEPRNCVAAGLRLVGCCLTGVWFWGRGTLKDVLSTVTISPIYPLDDSTWIRIENVRLLFASNLWQKLVLPPEAAPRGGAPTLSLCIHVREPPI